MIPTSDLRIAATRPLISPAILEYELPMTGGAGELVSATRRAAAAVLRGADPRLLVVVGPCSIHDPAAALDYAARLAPLVKEHAGELLIVMRVYFEKPRTTVGWKGLINDPHLDDTFDINHGLRLARKLLLDLAALGVPAGTEFLDTISPQYFADLIAWGAIGARTTECQLHRELASGLSMPVGFKNGTGGSIQIALDAIRAAAQPHRFLGVTKQGLSAIVSTTGNTDCHLILRGGQAGPNYDEAHTTEAVVMLSESGLNPHLMIDCSHGNSRKDHRRQSAIATELAHRIGAGEREIVALMIESNLVEGSQKHSADRSKLVPGCSITDACIGWEDTTVVLAELATAVRQRKIHA